VKKRHQTVWTSITIAEIWEIATETTARRMIEEVTSDE